MPIRDARRIYPGGNKDNRLDLLRDKASKDIPRFIRQNLRIIAGREAGKPQLVPLIPNWSQDQVLEVIHTQDKNGMPVRIIVLKSRQVGISTITSAYIYSKCWAENNTHALVMSNSDKTANNIFEMYQRFGLHLPPQLQLPMQRSNKQEILWASEIGSKIQVVTAGSPESARSRTPRHVQLSECGMYTKMAAVKAALEAGIPNVVGTSIILESTALGAGTDFHLTWQAAREGDGHYKCVFLEWFKDPACQTIEFPDQRTQDLYLEKVFDKYPQLKDRQEYFQLTPRQIAWYYEILHNDYQGDTLIMASEFPCTEQEAFRATGSLVFPLELMDQYRDKQRPAERYDPLMPFTCIADMTKSKYLRPNQDAYMDIWIEPQEGREYLIVADPAAGLQGSDYSCLYVMDIATQCIAATVHGRIAIKPFAKIIKKLGKIYKDAVLMPEVDGLGAALLEELKEDYFHIYFQRKDEGYGEKTTNKLGWETNQKSKLMCAGLARTQLTEKRELGGAFMPDIHLYEELANLTEEDLAGKSKAITDRAMAFIIGLQGCMHELKSRPDLALTIENSKMGAESPTKLTPESILKMIKDKNYVHGQPYDQDAFDLGGPFIPSAEGLYNLGDGI